MIGRFSISKYRPTVDLPLLLGILLLMGFGSLTVWSAGGLNTSMLERHSVRIVLSLAGLLFFSAIPLHKYRHMTPYLYGLSILLLLAVALIGDSTNGSQRWLNLAGVRFQPSELVKVAVPMMVAWFLSLESGRPQTQHVFYALILALVPAIFIFFQPDLDGFLYTILYALFVLYFAGMSWKIIGGSLGMIAIISPILWFFIMAPYQKMRVVQFLNPQLDPLGSGYQIIQSLIAIGSGGLRGKGFEQATQGQLGFIPESHTDFIFSTFAEEWGFIGTFILIGLYGFISLRALWLALQTVNVFARLTSGALALSFFFYAFVNMGMVSGLLPVMGVPLPFISYGGTAMITQGVCFGIIMALCRRPKGY